MSYLILLLLFWQPIYFGVRYFTSQNDVYKTKFINWFTNLWTLIVPSKDTF